MPSITAYAGTGSLLKVGDAASPEVFTTVANIKDIGGITLTRTVLPTGTHNFASTSSGFDDFILGLKKSGSIPLKLVWDPNNATHGTGALGIRGLYDSGAKVNMKITLGNVSPAVSLSFVAAVSEMGMEIPFDGVLMCNCKLEISGGTTQA